ARLWAQPHGRGHRGFSMGTAPQGHAGVRGDRRERSGRARASDRRRHVLQALRTKLRGRRMSGPDRGAVSGSPVKQDGPWMSKFDRMRLPLLVCGVVAVLWLVFGLVIVPPIIENAYRGESWPVLNGMIRGQQVHPVTFYLQLWRHITIVLFAS